MRVIVALLALCATAFSVSAQVNRPTPNADGTVSIPLTQPSVIFQTAPPVSSPNQPLPTVPVTTITPGSTSITGPLTITFSPQVPGSTGDAVTEGLWRALQEGGYVLLLRHGRTDATPFDAPGGVTIGDCSTQRMLSQAGRDDAVRLAEVFKRRGIPVDKVVSSEFCRAQETGRTGLGLIARRGQSTWDRLNYLSDPKLSPRLPEFTAEVRGFVSGFAGPGNLVLISHVTNTDPILQGTRGTGLAEMEFAIVRPVRPGKFEYLGRIPLTAW